MLRNAFELAKNAINQSSIIFKILLKVFKLFLYYQIFDFRAMFILMLLLNYHFIEKQNGKKILIRSISLSSFEIIFILLAKTIII